MAAFILGNSDAAVSHQMALAVNCVDAMTEQRVTVPVHIDFETPSATFAVRRPGRAVMFHSRNGPRRITVRVDDPTRQFVARRLTTELWTHAELASAEAVGTRIPSDWQLLEPWLLPGPAYRFTGGRTVVHGRVEWLGEPVRWPRILARDPTGLIGWAQGDERGEFVVAPELPYVLPTRPDTVDFSLHISAPAVRAKRSEEPVALEDPLADLVVEQIPRISHSPPHESVASLLQGRVVPPSYVTAPFTVPVTARLGTVSALAHPISFPP